MPCLSAEDFPINLYINLAETVFVQTYKGGDCIILAFRLIFNWFKNIRQLKRYINVIIKRLPFLFSLLFSTILLGFHMIFLLGKQTITTAIYNPTRMHSVIKDRQTQ